LKDSSERTYQHSKFTDSSVIRKDEGARREERTPEDEQDGNGEIDLPKGTGI